MPRPPHGDDAYAVATSGRALNGNNVLSDHASFGGASSRRGAPGGGPGGAPFGGPAPGGAFGRPSGS